jgi:hypothetical protein
LQSSRIRITRVAKQYIGPVSINNLVTGRATFLTLTGAEFRVLRTDERRNTMSTRRGSDFWILKADKDDDLHVEEKLFAVMKTSVERIVPFRGGPNMFLP